MPTDRRNFIDTFHFDLVFERIQGLTYTIQNLPLPGIALDSVEVPTNQPVNLPAEGDTLVYEPMTVSFLVDDEFKNYLEIYNWLQEISTMGYTDTSASLIVRKPNCDFSQEFEFRCIKPTNLGALEFTNVNQEPQIICDVTFAYTEFTPIQFTHTQ